MAHSGKNQYVPAKNPVFMSEQTEGLYDQYTCVSMIDQRKEHAKARKNLKELLDMIHGLNSIMITKRPYLARVYHLFADNCLLGGLVSEAKMVCEEGLHYFPESDELRLFYAHCLTRLHRFDEAEDILHQMDTRQASYSKHSVQPGLYTFRRAAALGELNQEWGRYEKARQNFNAALKFRDDLLSAHVGLIELKIIQQDIITAGRYLEKVIARLGPRSTLLLTAAHLALISKKFDKADDLAAQIQGNLLSDERFEYLLFLIDFFKGDRESLLHVPCMLQGQSVETEAARVWLLHLRGNEYKKDPSRIPEDVWREEYNELNTAWQEIKTDE